MASEIKPTPDAPTEQPTLTSEKDAPTEQPSLASEKDAEPPAQVWTCTSLRSQIQGLTFEARDNSARAHQRHTYKKGCRKDVLRTLGGIYSIQLFQ